MQVFDHLKYKTLIHPHKGTVSTTLSGVFDMNSCEEVAIILDKGEENGNNTIRVLTSDTVSATASGMTLITSGFLSSLNTSTLNYAIVLRKTATGARRFVGVTVYNTLSTAFSVVALGMRTKAAPPSTSGFTTIRRLPSIA